MSTRIRILLGIGLVLFAIGIGYLLYRVFFASPSTRVPRPPVTSTTSTPGTFPIGSDANRPPGTGTPGTGTLPGSEGTSGLSGEQLPTTPLVRTAFVGNAQNAVVSTNGRLQFYNADDGKFYRIDSNGNAQPLSDEIFFSADTVTWDTTGDKAIIEYPDGSNIVYNFTTKQPVTLPKHWEDFSFSRDGNQIAAKSLPVSEENRWLVTTDASGSNVQLIEPLGTNANKVIVDWSHNPQVIGFSRTGQALGLDREEVLLVGLNGENFKSLTVEGRDFRPAWSPDGKRVLYSVYSERSGFRPELWVVNASGDSIGEGRTFLNINTWADKCDFSTSNTRYVYCGVPESLERGAGFVPDVANQTADIIYRIDTQTGARTPVVSSQDAFMVVGSLHVDETNNRLYVTDKQTNNIFEIDL